MNLLQPQWHPPKSGWEIGWKQSLKISEHGWISDLPENHGA